MDMQELMEGLADPAHSPHSDMDLMAEAVVVIEDLQRQVADLRQGHSVPPEFS